VIKQRILKSEQPYKSSLVDFIKSKQWHWFITIPIGYCENDDEVVKRLREIEATLCGKFSQIVTIGSQMKPAFQWWWRLREKYDLEHGTPMFSLTSHAPPKCEYRNRCCPTFFRANFGSCGRS
jgi:hypothetical protein